MMGPVTRSTSLLTIEMSMTRTQITSLFLSQYVLEISTETGRRKMITLNPNMLFSFFVNVSLKSSPGWYVCGKCYIGMANFLCLIACEMIEARTSRTTFVSVHVLLLYICKVGKVEVHELVPYLCKTSISLNSLRFFLIEITPSVWRCFFLTSCTRD